jgi:hypothetical protein
MKLFNILFLVLLGLLFVSATIHIDVEIDVEAEKEEVKQQETPLLVGAAAPVAAPKKNGTNPVPAPKPKKHYKTTDFLDLKIAAVNTALKKGASSKGINASKYKLHVTSIIKAFNKYNAKKHYAAATGYLAYILATAEHETGRFIWLAEIGGASTRYAPYYGRGYVQLTWKNNYTKYNTRLHKNGYLKKSQNIVKNPNFLSSNTAQARLCMGFIIVDGSITGAFTGKSLSNFITKTHYNFYNARTIINGYDRASTVAGYATKWVKIIKKARKAQAAYIKKH